ncbi:hypothetical protein Scep_007302 [Stephania cephalantha]|uniref:Uncharacterized protein n=1 Tax=Stephania cephalantha TaxID=152367 RepID=A0AAP0KCA8_9MAGN
MEVRESLIRSVGLAEREGGSRACERRLLNTELDCSRTSLLGTDILCGHRRYS